MTTTSTARLLPGLELGPTARRSPPQTGAGVLRPPLAAALLCGVTVVCTRTVLVDHRVLRGGCLEYIHCNTVKWSW